MRQSIFFVLAAILFSLLGSGCSDTGKDSHTEAFTTPEQAVTVRRGQQRQGWQELGVTILTTERPGLTAKIDGSDAILLEADGVKHSVSLVSIYEALAAKPADERTTIRNYLIEQLRPFDAQRLQALGFDKLKEHLFPMLVNRKQLDEMRKIAVDPKHPPTAVPLFTNIFRITVVKWDKFGLIPVSPEMLGEKATQGDIDAAAMQNLRNYFEALPAPRIDVTDYGTLGRSGHLAGQGDAAVILLPEFAEEAQKALGSHGDLVLLAPTQNEVDFAPRKNEKLVDRLIPFAQKLAARALEPLCDQPILVNAEGLSLLAYTPTTQTTRPAAKTPASKPDIFIVQ